MVVGGGVTMFLSHMKLTGSHTHSRTGTHACTYTRTLTHAQTPRRPPATTNKTTTTTESLCMYRTVSVLTADVALTLSQLIPHGSSAEDHAVESGLSFGVSRHILRRWSPYITKICVQEHNNTSCSAPLPGLGISGVTLNSVVKLMCWNVS